MEKVFFCSTITNGKNYLPLNIDHIQFTENFYSNAGQQIELGENLFLNTHNYKTLLLIFNMIYWFYNNNWEAIRTKKMTRRCDRYM